MCIKFCLNINKNIIKRYEGNKIKVLSRWQVCYIAWESDQAASIPSHLQNEQNPCFHTVDAITGLHTYKLQICLMFLTAYHLIERMITVICCYRIQKPVKVKHYR